ncbi:MAG: helix-turn-helix domain-containing protein [Planctomyces sp.]|nr:helix-turn-helix domain-containing protein [Planctomyces sp.]
MRRLISPKQVARAIGVSESSLKRWCDCGLIRAERTAGGHRRLPLDSVMSFLRERGIRLVEPEVLGLPVSAGTTEWTIERAQTRFQEGLVSGDEETCRQIVHDLFLGRHDLARICDEVFARSFHAIGDLWSCGEVEAYEERRACGMALRLIHELRSIIPPPDAGAPVAIGGTVETDPYTLPTAMAEIVLRGQGWDATSLGTLLPFETVVAAVERLRPGLVWLSVSAIADEARFLDGMRAVHQAISASDSALVLGGCALTPELRRRMACGAFGDTIQHLASIAAPLIAARRLAQAAPASSGSENAARRDADLNA